LQMYRSAQKFLVSQFGLSTFKYSNGEYTAKTYNFNIYPRKFMNFDKRFACQASSLEFLTEHKFDFNKFIYDGVGYLSLEQQASMKEVRFWGQQSGQDNEACVRDCS
jgi:poly(A)-specific ribonuclease